MAQAIPLSLEAVRGELNRLAPVFGIQIDGPTGDRILSYSWQLCRWNARLNLIRFKCETDLAQLHLLESLFLTRFLDEGVCQITDVGSGAGFPGLPLAIALPGVKVQLVEKNLKKTIFLNETVRTLALTNVTVIHGLYADVPRDTPGVVVLRALERLSKLSADLFEHFSTASQFLFLGGKKLANRLETGSGEWSVSCAGIPLSRGRFVIQARRRSST